MALAKTDSSIESLRGKFGGVYFKKDNSGQHIQAAPRVVKKIPSESEKRQRAWYGGQKQEEHQGGPPDEGYEDPKGPKTATIFSLEVIWAYRKPSIFEPVITPIEEAGCDPAWIYDWINTHWQEQWALWGLSKNLMFVMMVKWWSVLKYIHGFSNSMAYGGAVVNMLEFISMRAAEFAVPALGLWGGLVVMGFFYAFLDWWEGQSGWVSFTKGRVLIKLKTGLCWGQIIARPSKKMYDFILCKPADFGSYQWDINPDTPKYMLNWLHLNEFWVTILPAYFNWYTFSWQTIKCRHRGFAYLVAPYTYRLECPPSQIEYWGHPIGWVDDNPYPCMYVNQLEDYFGWQQNPKPPL